MKRIFLLLIMLTLAACNGEAVETLSDEAIQTFIAQTLAAQPTSEEILPTNAPESSNTPLPTNTPEPTNTPRPTNTPKPTSTPTPIPEPIIIEGQGDDVVNVDKWSEPAILHVNALNNTGNIIIENYDEDGNKIDLLVNEIGSYEGRLPLDFRVGERTARMQIQAGGAWIISVYPLSPEYVNIVELPGTY